MVHNCVGIFCEDIREETSGTHTIIGVMPDNIMLATPANAEAGPGAALIFPRLGIYLRVNLDPSHKPTGPITARASIPGLGNQALGELTPADIEKAYADSAVHNFPVVGIIFKAVMSPVQIREAGIATAFVTIEGQEILAAMLNIQLAK